MSEEIINGNGEKGWTSRKFVSCVGSALSVMIYAGVAYALKWMKDDGTLLMMVFMGLSAIFLYSGINLAQKAGGVGNLFVPNRKPPE